eukprot:9481294-Pyramimonas_sp.AAC.1
MLISNIDAKVDWAWAKSDDFKGSLDKAAHVLRRAWETPFGTKFFMNRGARSLRDELGDDEFVNDGNEFIKVIAAAVQTVRAECKNIKQTHLSRPRREQ